MKYLIFICVITTLNTAALAGDDDLIFLHGFDACDSQSQCCAGETLLIEGFTDDNQSTWGGDWQLPGFEVAVEEVVNGEGCV